MTRKEIVFAAYKNGTIELDTFGQLTLANYSERVIERAIEREWITRELGNELLNAENPIR